MRIALAALAAVLLTGTAAGSSKPRDTPFHVGVANRTVHPAEPRNWRGQTPEDLRCTLWYPAVDTAVEVPQTISLQSPDGTDTPLFLAGSASPRAEPAPSLSGYPVILLSHGSGGSALQMAWLGTALARAGFIAIAVDHPGDNIDRMTPEGVALWWERALDLTDVLDALLKDPVFSPHIDPTRIAAAGYSLGGYTTLVLAGARTDISQLFELCRQHADAAVCHLTEARNLGTPAQILATARKTSAISLARSGDSFRDPRIKAVFAIAPALGFTLTPDSLHALHLPLAIVVGDADTIAPARDNADYLRSNTRGATETILPGVTHYTFLDTCTPTGRQQLERYCTDAPTLSRDAIHDQVSAAAITFFNRALKLR